MMYVRDESDVLPWNLAWYAALGLPTVAIDNGSTDGCSDILAKAKREGSVAAWRRIETSAYDPVQLLAAVLELASEQQPDALLLTSADEFFEVADGTLLTTAMVEDFEAGYNALRFANMEFSITTDDDVGEENPMRRMRYYSHRRVSLVRGYRYVEGMSLAEGLSHRPTFPPGMDILPSPRRYVSRHYPLRSVEQATRKLTRIRPTPDRPGAHTHYLYLLANESALVVDPRMLTRYEEDHRWNYRERLTGWRLKQTTRSLATLYLRYVDLERRHRELLRQLEADHGDSAMSSASDADAEPSRMRTRISRLSRRS